MKALETLFSGMVLGWVAALLLSTPGAAVANAADGRFPTRPVTLIVPAAPGGVVDTVARLLGKRLGEAWGEALVIENVAGADGLIATRKALAAKPDGYTLLLQIPTMLLYRHSHLDLGFEPLESLVPLAQVAQTPSAFAVAATLPVKTVKELVSYCGKASPSCTWGTGQALSYLYGRTFFDALGLPNLLNVPYKSSAPLMTDLAGGHITVATASVGGSIAHHQTGVLRILAVNSAARFPPLPDVPTFRESGIDVPPRGSWVALFAPAKTPLEVARAIERAVMGLSDDSAFRTSLLTAGAVPSFEGQHELAGSLKQEQLFLDGLVQRYRLK